MVVHSGCWAALRDRARTAFGNRLRLWLLNFITQGLKDSLPNLPFRGKVSLPVDHVQGRAAILASRRKDRDRPASVLQYREGSKITDSKPVCIVRACNAVFLPVPLDRDTTQVAKYAYPPLAATFRQAVLQPLQVEGVARLRFMGQQAEGGSLGQLVVFESPTRRRPTQIHSLLFRECHFDGIGERHPSLLKVAIDDVEFQNVVIARIVCKCHRFPNDRQSFVRNKAPVFQVGQCSLAFWTYGIRRNWSSPRFSFPQARDEGYFDLSEQRP